MKINILLPYKEQFDMEKASAVSITIRNNFVHSKFQENTIIFGRNVLLPIFPNNFISFDKPLLLLKSKNKFLAEKYCEFVSSSSDKCQILEVHNRPHLINYIYKKLHKFPLCLFLHNDPQNMDGTKTPLERINILKKCSAIYCVSNFIKKRFLEDVNNYHDKVYVLYNGVPRTINKFPNKKKEVLFVGRIVPEKGIEVYINAIKRLFKKFPEWNFLILGSNRLGESSKSRFAKKIEKEFNKIGNQAKFKGFVNQDQVQINMQNASIVVVPSLWNEPFGLVVAEAMSNGAAIIASKVGAIPELLEKNGILINDINEKKLKENLVQLMSNVELLEKFQKLSWNNFKLTSKKSSTTLDLYRSILIKKIVN